MSDYIGLVGCGETKGSFLSLVGIYQRDLIIIETQVDLYLKVEHCVICREGEVEMDRLSMRLLQQEEEI